MISFDGLFQHLPYLSYVLHSVELISSFIELLYGSGMIKTLRGEVYNTMKRKNFWLRYYAFVQSIATDYCQDI